MGVADDDAQAVTNLVCREVERLDASATTAYRVDLDQIGSSVVLTIVVESAPGVVRDRRRAIVRRVEDLATVAPRLARALVLGTDDEHGGDTVSAPVAMPVPETGKGEGAECETGDQCRSGKCKHERCFEGGVEDGEEKPKEKPKRKALRTWAGFALQIDNYLVPSANDVCKLAPDGTQPATSGNPYWCTDSSGGDYPADPNTNDGIVAGRSDQVQGAIKPLSNLRVLVTLDYALDMNTLVGVRGGYVLGTYPGTKAGAFAPIQGEVRLTYLLGKNALAKKGFSPMVFGAAGAGEFDAYVPVVVFLQGQSTPTTANAWVVAGPAFGAVGAGGRMMLTPTLAATVAAKGEVAFGGTAGTLVGFAPEAGMQIGF